MNIMCWAICWLHLFGRCWCWISFISGYWGYLLFAGGGVSLIIKVSHFIYAVICGYSSCISLYLTCWLIYFLLGFIILAITAGFKMFQQIDLYMLPTLLAINTMKCVSLYFVYVKIELVHSSSPRCVLSSSTRCVFKIYNVTRLGYVYNYSFAIELRWVFTC